MTRSDDAERGSTGAVQTLDRINLMAPAFSSNPSSIWPAIIVATASGAWGLYWLPVRALHEAGVPLAWVPALLYATPCVLLALAGLLWERSGFTLRSAITGFLAGAALAFYTDALLLTEVVRVLIFFYLTPVWSTILERVFLGVRVSWLRIAAMVIGFSGMGIAVDVVSQDFLSRINTGDILALASGIAWAWATLRIYSGPKGSAIALSTAFLAFGALVAVLLALLGLGDGAEATVDRGRIVALLPWFLAFGLLVVVPSSFAMMWGANILSPGLVGILLMTEVTVGTVSAALWAGETIGLREVAGLTMVTFAGVLEVGYGVVARRLARP